MKTIASVKLHKRGKEGIEIKFHQLSKQIPTDKKEKENDQVYDDQINVYRRDFVPKNIMDAIDRLKYFLLNITGYWIHIYDNYVDFNTYKLLPPDENAKESRRHLQTLWDNVYVTQIKMDLNSFTIMGMFEHIENKPLNLNPARITANDDLVYYENARDQIKRLFGVIIAYFSTAAISDIDDYRKYLLSHTDEAGKKEIASFDEEQIVNRVVDLFSHRGMIVMMETETPDLPGAIEQKTTDTPAPSEDFEPEPEDIDASIMESEFKLDEGESWTPPVEKVNPFGAPLAENSQMDPGPVQDEYSEDTGVGDLTDDGIEDPLESISDEEFVV
jgi:hypothetical protein